MITYIFINRLRYERLRYHEAKDICAGRYVAVFDQEFYVRIPDIAHAALDSIICLKEFHRAALTTIIAEEVRLAGSAENVRIICWEEEIMELCGELRSEFSIQGPTKEALLPFRHKLLMKSMLVSSEISVPRFIPINDLNIEMPNDRAANDIINVVGLPLIAKPIAGYGAFGARKIDHIEALDAFLSTIYRLDEWDFEAFIEGDICSCDCILAAGKIIFCGVTRSIGTPLEFVSGYNRSSYIVDPASPLFHKVRTLNQHIIEALNPPTAATHLELILKPDGELVFLEIAARPAGGEIWRGYDHAFGVDLVRTLLSVELEEVPAVVPQAYTPTGWTYFSRQAGNVKAINEPVLRSDFVKFDWKVSPGDSSCTSAFVFDRAGTAFYSDPSLSVVLDDVRQLKTFNPVQMITP